MKEKVYLSIGSNIGKREEYIRQSFTELENHGRILQASPVYETDPWGFKSSRPFLNLCISFETALSPEELMREILKIEKTLGRERNRKDYSDRTIDIDILFYSEKIIRTAFLEVPHPAIAKRRFVLQPLNDIASDFTHPVSGKRIRTLLEECKDNSGIEPFEL